MSQLHQKFSDNQVKELIKKYLQDDIDREYLQDILEIKRRRFFELLKTYKHDPDNFSIRYKRGQPTRQISMEMEENILKELTTEKKVIEDPNTPLRNYNYSYVKDLMETKYDQKVSLPTIIDRAKKHGFYFKKKKKRAIHDREVLTNFVGELIQHDSSYHLWAPAAKEK